MYQTANYKAGKKEFILDIFFPNHCPFCHKVIRWDLLCCEECFDKLEWTFKCCPKCGHRECICDETELFYDRCYSALYYNNSTKDGFIQFKYHNNFNLNWLICDTLTYRINNSTDKVNYDMIVPIPMNPLKKHQRGYNQAEEMGKLLSKGINSPMKLDVIGKKYGGKFQHSLGKEERLANVEEVFFPRNISLNGMRILICDDIMTTGATLNHCAKILKEMGAERVDIAVGGVTGRE